MKTYTSRDDVFEIVRSSSNDTFCFAIEIDEFDINNDIYDVQFMFSNLNLPDSNNDPYDYSIIAPSLTYYSDYEKSGFLGLYPIVSRIIMLLKGIPMTV